MVPSTWPGCGQPGTSGSNSLLSVMQTGLFLEAARQPSVQPQRNKVGGKQLGVTSGWSSAVITEAVQVPEARFRGVLTAAQLAQSSAP